MQTIGEMRQHAETVSAIKRLTDAVNRLTDAIVRLEKEGKEDRNADERK